MPTLHRFKVDKLIRNIVSENLSRSGILVRTKEVSDVEFVESLKRKLVEESKEVLVAKDQEELIEEIGDVLQVMKTLCQSINISFEAVEKSREAKEKRSGTFDKKTYCTIIDVPKSHPNYVYYKGRPEDYPEIEMTPLSD